MVTPVLAGFGAAFPPAVTQDALWEGFFAARCAGMPAARRVFAGAGVRRRHAVVDPLVEDVSTTGTGERMRRYRQAALPLATDAVRAALAEADVPADEVGMLAVVTCTGYDTPGVDIGLAAGLGMAGDVRRLLVGHMGCYAALPGLAAVADYVTAQRRPAVLLCVELTSLHVQPATGELSQVVAHALFSDAAAAVVLLPDAGCAGRYRLRHVATATDPTTADQMTWQVTDHGFRMDLSARVPESLAAALPGLTERLLAEGGYTPPDVAGWAVHPGGPRILDVAGEVLKLPPEALWTSREVLAEHGNCSSATVLLVLRRLLSDRQPDGPVVALAFGPGLTLYGALLEPC